MNNFIDIQRETTPSSLLKNNQDQSLYALIRLNPLLNISNKKIPLDLRMALDRSSSMGQRVKGNSNKTALSLLKEASKESIELLEVNDKITIFIFSNKSVNNLPSLLIKGKDSYKKAKKAIGKISSCGCTHLSSSIRDILNVNSSAQYIKRVLIFTDGEVNVPSQQKEEKDCLLLAKEARKKGIPFWVYGLGISYNEKFLKDLAKISGGYFYHISEPSDMINLFKEQMTYFQNVAITNVEINMDTPNGVNLLKISRVVPDINNYSGFMNNYFASSLPDIDQVRGIAILVQLEVKPQNFDKLNIMDISLTYDIPTLGIQGAQQKININISFTDNPLQIQQNQKVIDVVTLQGAHDLTTLAAIRAETGQGKQATQMMNQAAKLYQKAGNDDMSKNLITLSNSLKNKGAITGENLNTRRTLTSVSSQLITRRLTNSN